MDKYAAIDLGTNTFHLLIASFGEDGKLIVHFRDRQYIHLAEKGIEKIGEEAFGRALRCIEEFHKYLKRYEIKHINCSGTAALRTASNGIELVERIWAICGIKVNIIDGIKEAKYIYRGVKLAVPGLVEGNHIIMDIGGGSVEFIIIKDGHFYWSNSFPVGIAILKRLYHHNEPISIQEINNINGFLGKHLKKMFYECKNIQFESLIGASGSFEVLAGMLDPKLQEEINAKVPISFFNKMYEEIIHQDLNQRLKRTDIPNNRAHLIIVALQIIKFILTRISIKKITVSAYAMKEGILKEIKENQSQNKAQA